MSTDPITTPEPDPTTEPIGEFGATVADVADLLPQATIPVTLEPGRRGVTVAMVKGYLLDVDGRVAMRLSSRRTGLDVDHAESVDAAARGLVATGAASYTQTARFPEQAANNSDSYGAVLWSRFESGLNELAKAVDGYLAQPATQTDTAAAAGAGAWFPEPYFTDGMQF